MKIDGMIRVCGLDFAEAARYLGVSRGQLRAWAEGREEITDIALLKLTELFRRQADAADAIIDAWARAGGPKEIEVEMPATTEDAVAHGWPCVRSVECIAAAVQLEISPARLRVIRKESARIVDAHAEDVTAAA